ncbi:MAG: hypothetical protein ACJASV_002859 [Pseudorhodobacter sp.]|jgi:hypothetical protein
MELHWDQLDKETWDNLLGQAGRAPLQQCWDYGVAMEALGARAHRVAIIDAGRVVAVAQLLQCRRLRLILRGPIWLCELDPAQQRRVLRQLARFAGPVIATLEGCVSGFGLVPLITPRYHALWSLRPDEADLRAGLAGKWRNRLKKAEGLTITQSAGQSQIMAAEVGQRQVRGYKALPPAFLAHWPGEKRVLQWHSQGALQAGMVFLIHGAWASYHLSWASDIGRAAFAHGPMLWQAAMLLKRRGVTCLDLGDVNSDQAPGLMHFKLGTGAVPKALGATVWVLPGA